MVQVQAAPMHSASPLSVHKVAIPRTDGRVDHGLGVKAVSQSPIECCRFLLAEITPSSNLIRLGSTSNWAVAQYSLDVNAAAGLGFPVGSLKGT